MASYHNTLGMALEDLVKVTVYRRSNRVVTFSRRSGREDHRHVALADINRMEYGMASDGWTCRDFLHCWTTWLPQ